MEQEIPDGQNWVRLLLQRLEMAGALLWRGGWIWVCVNLEYKAQS